MKRPELLITNGALQGRRLAVPEVGLRLGRASTNDLCVPDEGLSRNHCLFEQSGDAGIRVIDLASANGTYVNGESAGDQPRELKVGDMVEVGTTVINVVGDQPVAAVDLGLGANAARPGSPGTVPAPGATANAGRRRLIVNALLGLVAAAAGVTIWMVLTQPVGDKAKPAVATENKARSRLTALQYEKVEADARHVFRYWMTVDGEGTLRVTYDDVPGENRHADKSGKLDAAALARVTEILSNPEFLGLEPTYAGMSAADENALRSWRIRFAMNGKVKDTLVENVAEPEAFRTVREALEAFSRNELGIWAIQYSKEKLIELSAQSEATGNEKWDERDVEYGNLAESIRNYREAVYYLETVNPKPDGFEELREKLRRSESELSKRYADQRFLADKAINAADWEAAIRELRVLIDMVPERADDRHAEASAKLVDVENRIKKAKGKKK